MTRNPPSPPSFGGNWTAEKLKILGKYLAAYTKVLKKQRYRLVYVDAFAGSGEIALPDMKPSSNNPFLADHFAEDERDKEAFLKGSVQIALDVINDPFDELIFIEKDPERCRSLEDLRNRHQKRHIEIKNEDANEVLRKLKPEHWEQQRGVLFLDPFATQIEWRTLEVVANLKALDTWMLFPTSAVIRMLPKTRRPEDISDALARKLNRIFGDDSWGSLYHDRHHEQFNLFGHEEHGRDSGVGGLVELYKKRLHSLFGDRFLEKSKTLYNSKNSPLFEFLFCAGNPSGTTIAKRIARHLLRDL